MSVHDRLAELALRDGNTPKQFRSAAKQHANAFWLLGLIAGAAWYFAGWAWAAIPLVVAVLSAARSVSATMTAANLERLLSGPPGPSAPPGRATKMNLNTAVDAALVEDVRSKYGAVLADEVGPYAHCMFKPAELLPYPRVVISRALEALLDYVEGRSESNYLDPRIQTPDVAEAVRSALAHLDDFLDVPPEELPTEPRDNARVGFGVRAKLGGA